MFSKYFSTVLTSSLIPLLCATASADWLSWRGPLQTGVGPEQENLPVSLDPNGETHRWSYDVRGAGTPVIMGEKLFAFGFYGETGHVEETLLCLNAFTGKKIWEHRFQDFISDIIYNRYAIGAPVIDPETGNVYVKSTNGVVKGFTPDGELLWEHSMMEEYARLTFPNGRTGAPVIEGPLVIVHGITANWGTNGPARDRFYAFDKLTGELVWYSTPGVRPIDSSFSTPVFGNLGKHRVFYAGTGCGNIVCVNARTGEPVWRFQLAIGGVNSGVLLHGKDKLIAIHGKENVDNTEKGRLVCLKIPTEYPTGDLPLVLGADVEVWRNTEHVSFTSSPTLHEDKVYSTIATGSLLCVDAKTGKTLWRLKLAPDQLHASPAIADGKLYAPMLDGTVHTIDITGDKPKVLSATKKGAALLGSPAFSDNNLYLFSKEALHCYSNKEPGTTLQDDEVEFIVPKPGKIAQLQVVPAEFALLPGQSQQFTVWGLDEYGNRVEEISRNVEWEKWIPPTARVKSTVDGEFISRNRLIADKNAKISAGAFKASWKDLSTTIRGRIVADTGYEEDFEDVELALKNDAGEAVAFPPLPWLGARVKWHILERDDSKVAANRLDVVLFQRTMNFIGDTGMKNYILQADVMTDGNRRILSNPGLVNQRYLIVLDANSRQLEISSNHERLKESVPFRTLPNKWYTLKTHVKANGDGSGAVRAKVWPRGEDEPGDWTIEVPVKKVHEHGAPGIFAFSPQSQKRIYIDNLKIIDAAN